MQLDFSTIITNSRADHERRIDAYLVENRAGYLKAAERIKPDLSDARQVYSRVAFAILSANCPFDASVKALKHAAETDYDCDVDVLAQHHCVPFKADALRLMRRREPSEFLRARGERWTDYRERLKRTTPGLARCKASFAVSLLYPTRANVACLDTWMCKVIFGTEAFVTLDSDSYDIGEGWVRRFARKHKLPSTFLAQWAIWDHTRAGKLNEHNIFPGAHKEEA